MRAQVKGEHMLTGKKAARKKPGEKVSRQVEAVRSSNYGDVYSDYASLRISSLDMKIVFSQILSDDDEKMRVEDQASVTMTPEHALEVWELLGRNIKMYEAKVGELRQGSTN